MKTRNQVKNTLLNGERVAYAGWSILVNSQDQVVTRDPSGTMRTASFMHFESAVSDFCKAAGIPEKVPALKKYPAVQKGVLGPDTSTNEAFKEPKVQKQPVMQGKTPEKGLGADTSMNDAFRSPAVNRRPQPSIERGGLMDRDLGPDSSTREPKFGGRYAQLFNNFNSQEELADYIEELDLSVSVGDAEEFQDILTKYFGNSDRSIKDLVMRLDSQKADRLLGDLLELTYDDLEEDDEDFYSEASRKAQMEDSGDMDEEYEESFIEEMAEHLDDMYEMVEDFEEMEESGHDPYYLEGGDDEDEEDSEEDSEEEEEGLDKFSKIVDSFLEPKAASTYEETLMTSAEERMLNDLMDPDKWAANQLAYMIEPEDNSDKTQDRTAVAPPGMEDVVKKLKKDPDVDNPYAVAWSMYDKKEARKAVRLKENWGDNGAYGRDMEAETAEELYHMVRSFGSEDDYDWSAMTPREPGQVTEEELQSVQARAAQTVEGMESSDSYALKIAYEYGQDAFNNGMTGNPYEDDLLMIHLQGEDRSVQVQAMELWKEGYEAARQESISSINQSYLDLYNASKNAADEYAKEYWGDYLGEYGKDLTDDAGTDVKQPEKEESDIDEDRGNKGEGDSADVYDPKVQTSPKPQGQQSVGKNPIKAQAAPQAPAQDPQAPAQAPAAPAKDPKQAPAQAPAAPAKPAQPATGAGDEGLKALGWTDQDIMGMQPDQKQKVLQVQLQKPGTQPGQNAAPAPVKPAPTGQPAQAPAAQPKQAPAQPAPTAARAMREAADANKSRKAFQRLIKNAQEAPVAPQEEAPVPAVGQPAQAPAAAPEQPAQKPAGPSVMEEGSPEQKVYNIYREVLDEDIAVSTAKELPYAKAMTLTQRVMSEVGMSADELKQLFGTDNLSTLFKG